MDGQALVARNRTGVDPAGGRGTVVRRRKESPQDRAPMTGENFDRLPTPPLVADMLARLGDRPAAERAEAEREFKLSCYYGGMMVAGEQTPDGLVVVASGPMEEVGAALRDLPHGSLGRLVYLFPAPLAEIIPHLPGRPVPAAG